MEWLPVCLTKVSGISETPKEAGMSVQTHDVQHDPKVLATAYVNSKRIEVVEHPDGRSEITCDGVTDCQWAQGNLDACMESFLHMMRRRVVNA
jgi:hypothetical protein